MAQRIVLNRISHHGQGALEALPTEIRSANRQKALVVTDPELLTLGVTAKVTDILDRENLPYTVFSDLRANPSVENVQAGVRALKDSGADYIIAVGGGSAIDTAKGIGIIATNPDFADVVSLEGVAETTEKALFTIAIPTTAGTAAEVTINYVITDEANKRKMVCVDVHDIPEVAIVDPEMTRSMPKGLAAATGMDALTHAIEGYTTKAAWAMTDMFHIEAIRLIATHLRGAVAGNMADIEAMALAQYVAGMGFSNVGLGIVHSMAHPLGALYDTAHGVANAIILPEVMTYNAEATGEKYRAIADAMGVEGAFDMSLEDARTAAVDAVRTLAKDVGIPADLKDIVRTEDIPFLAESAFADACRPGNPRDTSVEEITALYESMV